jgi:hypothetical protein
MKKGLILLLVCLCSLVAMAQTGAYDRRWSAVDSLMNKKGLTASALREVNTIYELARREKNEGQLIKALIYRIRLEQKTSDAGLPAAIKEMEKQVDSSRGAVKAILENMLARLYASYLQENRWKFSSRTQPVEKTDSDLTTWSIPDFNQKIAQLYQQSIEPEQLLTHIELKQYQPIILEGQSPGLRPTLWDLLAHRALDYFKIGPGNQTGSVHPFSFNDPHLFADAGAFSQYRFTTGDSLDTHFLAIRLFQRLIRLHLADPKPDALIAVDVERLNFVRSNDPEKRDDVYMQALGRITERYPASPATAEAWYWQANLHYFDAVGTEGPVDSNGCVKARAICEKVIALPDSSEGKTLCTQFLQTILRKEITLQMEKVHIPSRPFPVLASWQNLNRVFLRIVRLDDNSVPALMQFALSDSVILNRLLTAPAYRAYAQELPDPQDLRLHKTEIAIGSLPPGAYALLTSSDSSWSRKQGVLGLQYFVVSSIAYISRDNDYFVVNRETGKPIAGAKAQFLLVTYSPGGRQTTKVVAAYTTDADGHFVGKLGRGSHDYGAQLDISIPGDHLWPLDNQYFSLSVEDTAAVVDKNKYEEENARCYFFSDRSIYRPGQTIYFKGIATTEDFDTRRPKALTGQTTIVTLLDPNSQIVDSIQLTTNEFGTFHGSLKLPENRLNGQYQLNTRMNGYLAFSVEEYKRPKFYVDYDKQTGSFKVGDSIRVTGVAKGYAGNGIDGARVSYHVVRKTRYPYSWMFGRIMPPYRPDQEIASGTLTTDAAGRFSLVFFATPGQEAQRKYNPEFDFQVNTDVTDINGETRSGTTDIMAGFTAVKVSVALAGGDRVPADSMRSIWIGVSNLAGVPVAADVQVTIYPLQAPQRLIRERLWDAPDRYTLPEAMWLDSFPHDEYRHESQKESWPRGGKVWDTLGHLSAGSGVSGEPNDAGRVRLAVPAGVLEPGEYVVEATTKDKYGNEVKDLRYVELYDGRTGRPAGPQYSWGSGDVDVVEPGEKALTTTGTSADNVYVIRSVERNGQTRYSNFSLNADQKQTEWAIAETDRGGFAVMDAFIKDNRLYTHSSVVHVPWTNKELDIHYTSFRDKTQPGSPEKWQLTIGGHRGEKVAAEILSALYDASLDQFSPHSWAEPDLYPSVGSARTWNSIGSFNLDVSRFLNFDRVKPSYYFQAYSELMEPLVGQRIRIRGRASITRESNKRAYLADDNDDMASFRGNGFYALEGRVPGLQVTNSGDMFVHAQINSKTSDSIVFNITSPAPGGQPMAQPRTDFRETAFFLPDLRTDSAGNVSFSFTMPDALTTWKWMTLASTRDLAFGYSTRQVITQKELMVQPNTPRFLREGDKMELPVKVVNMTDSELTGQMSLQLTDPTTGQTADGWFVNRQPNQYFTVGAHQSFVVGFPLDIPYQYNRPVTYRVVAQAGAFSDGEEATLPVVSNRMLVTESLPLNLPGDGTQHYTFDKLLKSGSSETLNHHALTVEFTANPAWYAIQSLPYLAEYPYECAEQTFERAYANALASKIATSSPRLQQVFTQWRTTDTAMFLSNLQKNQELKSVLLEETPWVLQGKTEAEQKKNIALLFDMDRMSQSLESAFDKLKDMQSASGGFPWFKGGVDDRYITQYIVTGIGHLQKLQAIPAALTVKANAIVAAALPYLDGQLKKDYDMAKAAETRAGKPLTAWLGALPIEYLYMRSLLADYAIPGDVFPAVNYFRKKTQQGWVERNKYLQAMTALALYRTGDVQTAKDIVASLRQNAIRDPEKGMYWKGMEGGYFWYEAPVETQCMLIEAFHEISGDAVTDGELKTWLLRQKQTHSWPTTTATANACYALLLGGADWLNAERSVEVRLGDKNVDMAAEAGAGIGYYKKIFDAPFVNPSMGNITVTMRTQGGGGSPAWGAVYWQYFDMLDRITSTGAGKPVLGITKKLYVRRNTDHGPVLDTLADNATLHSGDRVVVRMIVKADRDMEYVHVKDMRAACFEPEEVLSGYKWQEGLSYYATTRDASTDLFFSRLPRGTHVLEYTLLAGQSGNFSNGVTTIECMYAPEFSYHSEGIRVNVEAMP